MSEEIANRGIKIQSVICDGHMGCLFTVISIQKCIFHKVAILGDILKKAKPSETCESLCFLGKTPINKILNVYLMYHTIEVSFFERKMNLASKTATPIKNLEVLTEA